MTSFSKQNPKIRHKKSHDRRLFIVFLASIGRSLRYFHRRVISCLSVTYLSASCWRYREDNKHKVSLPKQHESLRKFSLRIQSTITDSETTTTDRTVVGLNLLVHIQEPVSDPPSGYNLLFAVVALTTGPFCVK